MNTWSISLLVNNHFGVLTRVTNLFGRRGYNIASLSVGETHQEGVSRITVQTNTDVAGIHQVMKQLLKLEDVKRVQLLPGAETITRELMLIKVIAPPGRREKLMLDLSAYPAFNTLYMDESKIVIEYSGSSKDCDELLLALREHTIVEMTRTGVTALSTTSEINTYIYGGK